VRMCLSAIPPISSRPAEYYNQPHVTTTFLFEKVKTKTRITLNTIIL
jgi:hypothetical protein